MQEYGNLLASPAVISPRPLLLCLLLLLPWSVRATTPIVQYPVQGKVPASSLRSATDLILGGVQFSKGRGGFEPGSPFLLPAACSPVTSACLAALGKGQHVLYADAKAKEDGQVLVTVWLVSPAGERSRPVRFEFDPFLQNARSGYQAIALLEQQAQGVGQSAEASVPTSPSPVRTPSQAGPSEAVAAASGTTPPGASEPVAAATGPTAASPQSAPEPLAAATGPTAASPQSGSEPAGSLSTSSSTAPPTAVSLSDPEPPHPSAWLSTAGNIGTYGGLGVLAGGAVFGLLSRSIHDDLSARYQAGALRASDAGKYQQVRTFNLLANSLMIGGAVASAVGLTFWALAPSASPAPGGGTISVSGRF